MAKTIDELVVKITAEGTAQVTEATKAMDGLDASTKKTTESLKGAPGQIRNVAFQVQDMAVQIAGGTSAFVALGQQLPQLLGGFGVMGAVIGAVAAVGIPLFRLGLQAAGIDMRDLKEHISDLTNATKEFQDSQRANQTSLQLLGYEFGNLSIEAKKFYEVRNQLNAQRAEVELTAALKELNSDYSRFTKASKDASAELDRFHNGAAGAASTLGDLGDRFKAWRLDLTVAQATEVAERLKGIEKAKPEEAAATLRGILEYLQSAGVESGKFLNFFEKTVKPVIELNNQILENKRNLTAAAEAARDFSVALLDAQRQSLPDIGNARRNFDSIKAFRLEGEEKIKEFAMQKAQETAKDSVDRSKEVAAFRLKTEAEVAEKSKDFAQGQSETYKAAVLTNDAKRRQLGLESDIMTIQDMGRQSAEYDVKYAEDIIKLSKEYDDALISIGEQRRKNLITSQAALKLEADALALRNQGQGNAEQARAKAIADIQDEARKKNISSEGIVTKDQLDRAIKLRDQLRTISDQKIAVEFESQAVGTGGLTKQFNKIQQDAEISAAAARRAFSDMFGAGELSPEKSKERADGLALITKGFQDIADAQKANVEASREWSAGWSSAMDDYVSSATNAADQASTLFNSATKGMEDAFVKFAMTGKLSFKDLADSIISDLVRIMIRRAMASAMGGGFTALGGLFGFASGGDVSANQPVMVGEQGPEAFIPASNGTIIPNNKLGGDSAPTQVTYNINAVDASSFRSMVARDPQFIYNITEVGRRGTPSRRLA